MTVSFHLDVDRCSACGACAIACMDQHDTDVERGDPLLRCVFLREDPTQTQPALRYQYYSIGCMHCQDAPCVCACPAGCLYKDETGLTLFRLENCIGCQSCALACPFGVPAFGPDGKLRKCDGCIDRLRHGLQPCCTQACPTGALSAVLDGTPSAGQRQLDQMVSSALERYR